MVLFAIAVIVTVPDPVPAAGVALTNKALASVSATDQLHPSVVVTATDNEPPEAPKSVATGFTENEQLAGGEVGGGELGGGVEDGGGGGGGGGGGAACATVTESVVTWTRTSRDTGVMVNLEEEEEAGS